MFNTTIWQVLYWYGPAMADTLYGKEYYNSREDALEFVDKMVADTYLPDGNMHFVIRQFDFTATVQEASI